MMILSSLCLAVGFTNGSCFTNRCIDDLGTCALGSVAFVIPPSLLGAVTGAAASAIAGQTVGLTVGAPAAAGCLCLECCCVCRSICSDTLPDCMQNALRLAGFVTPTVVSVLVPTPYSVDLSIGGLGTSPATTVSDEPTSDELPEVIGALSEAANAGGTILIVQTNPEGSLPGSLQTARVEHVMVAPASSSSSVTLAAPAQNTMQPASEDVAP